MKLWIFLASLITVALLGYSAFITLIPTYSKKKTILLTEKPDSTLPPPLDIATYPLESPPPILFNTVTSDTSIRDKPIMLL
jgi:hypothetical protein